MASKVAGVGIDAESFQDGVSQSKGHYVDDPFAKKISAKTGSRVKMTSSTWVEHFVRIKDGDTGVVKKMDFAERGYLKRPYDSVRRKKLFLTSRQTEKSTTVGNIILSSAGMNPGFESLFVSPSAMQTKVFSSSRLHDIIDISPLVKALTHKDLTMNILEKVFANRSRVYLRYAFLNADRIRGLSVSAIFADEIQDLLQDVMPVIEETASHRQNPFYLYSGTPKSFDNTIEHYWSKASTQSEWCIPCERHGTPNDLASWHWNVLGPNNLGKTGPVCDRCKKRINPEHPMAQWVEMNPGAEFEGFRICRLMVPWYFKNPNKWKEILLARERYSIAQFMNEVLALSYDSGVKPITRMEVIRACDDTYTMDEDAVAVMATNHTLYGGVDWGCHDEQTRILTDRGFVHFRDLGDDDLVAQWDPDTRAMTFVVPTVRTVRDWDQPLLHFENRGGLDLMITPTHRMRVGLQRGDTWTTESAGETAARRSKIRFVGSVSWAGEDQTSFVLPGVDAGPGYPGSEARSFFMDDWLEFVGYLITEGGLCYAIDRRRGRSARRASCLKLSQRETVNPETTGRIRAVMDRLGITYQQYPNPKTGDVNWTICGKQYWEWYAKNVGVASDTKRLPRAFLSLSQRQLRILFQAMVDGDGTVGNREGCTGGAYYSTSKGLCEDFQEICIRLGLRCVVRLHKPAAGNRKTRWRALWSEGRDHQFNEPSGRVRSVPYAGKVYCCAVPSGYIVTERNGTVAYQGNTGEGASYTLFTVGGYTRGDSGFQVVYARRFDGPLVDPELQLIEIIRLIRKFRLKYVGCDYGMGFVQNKKLISTFGPKRVHQFQYAARAPRKLVYKGALHRFLAFRTPVMADLFNAIKAMKVRLPAWPVFKAPYADDILSIRSEYSETMRMIKYDKPRGITDDTFHSILYGLLVSMFDHQRPDIMAPIREVSEHDSQNSAAEDAAIMDIEMSLPPDEPNVSGG